MERFVTERDKRINEARTYIADFMSGLLPKAASSEVGRALRRFAVVATAGEMATDMGITGWEPGEAAGATARCFHAWINWRGGTGQADMQAALRQVKAFFEANGASRFQSTITRMDKGGDDFEERVFSRAGYWKTGTDGERLFLVYSEAFQREVCAGFDAQAVAAELAKQGFLLRGDGRNLTRRESVPNEGQPRFYVIRSGILE